jgi:hypothetical protein
VGELEALAPPEEQHRVLARVVAPAQRLDADRALRPRADLSRALQHEPARHPLPARLGHRLGQPQRGPARGVALRRVVELHDLGVVARSQPPHRLAHQPDEHVHGHREVGRVHHGDPLR